MAFKLEQLVNDVDGTQYDTVEAYGGQVRIGSLGSADMIGWLEDNDDAQRKRFAGLRLLVKSIVDDDGNRIPPEEHEAAVEKFKVKDARENGKVISRALTLNGLNRSKAATDAIKNALGEVTSDASPSASPSPSVE